MTNHYKCRYVHFCFGFRNNPHSREEKKKKTNYIKFPGRIPQFYLLNLKWQRFHHFIFTIDAQILNPFFNCVWKWVFSVSLIKKRTSSIFGYAKETFIPEEFSFVIVPFEWHKKIELTIFDDITIAIRMFWWIEHICLVYSAPTHRPKVICAFNFINSINTPYFI